MEKKMESTLVQWGIYWGSIGLMERKWKILFGFWAEGLLSLPRVCGSHFFVIKVFWRTLSNGKFIRA